MQRKNLKRLSIVLSAAMLIGCLAACGGKDTQENDNKKTDTQATESQVASSETQTETEAEGVTYPLEGNPTLTIAFLENSIINGQGAANVFETPFGKAWQEATGVTVEAVQLSGDDAMNLYFAGGELADIILYNNFNNYSGGATKAIKDGIIEPLNDYLEYMPDMVEALHRDESFWKQSTLDDGTVIGAPFVREDVKLRTSAGLIVRQDWLDELNMEVPQTPDEVYEVLKAFKEQKGAEAPFTLTCSWWLKQIGLNHGLLTSPFGLVKTNFYQVDGVAHYGFYEQEYKDVLAWLNKLYTEGLLDQNFQTVDQATQNANIMNGVSGMTIGSTGGNLGSYLNTMAESDPDYNLTGMSPLVANRGDVAMSTHFDNPITGYFSVITPQCKDKELAAKFLNYAYTEEGEMLCNFGIEGVSYEMVDGYPTYTDLILHNEDGLTVQEAMSQYCAAAVGLTSFMQQEEYVEQYYALDQQKAALEAWSTSNAKDYQMPALTMTEDESKVLSKYQTDIDTYIEEMMIKYITGMESLDTFETEYLPTLKQMGVEDIIAAYQTALDRYNAR